MPTLTLKTEDLYCCYATFQHRNYLTTLCPQCPLFCCLLAGAPVSAASLTFSQHHISALPLCVWAGYCCLQSKNKPHKPKKPHTANPQIPEPPKPHHQRFILRTRLTPWSCFSVWKATEFFAWCFVFFSDSFITGRKMNICICSTCHATCGVVKKDKSCIRTDSAADQAIPLSSPAASFLPPHSSCNLSYLSYLPVFHVEKKHLERTFSHLQLGSTVQGTTSKVLLFRSDQYRILEVAQSTLSGNTEEKSICWTPAQIC